MNNTTSRPSRVPIPVRSVLLIAVAALGTGCMKMQTQQTTLQHSETVVTPVADGLDPGSATSTVVQVSGNGPETDRRN